MSDDSGDAVEYVNPTEEYLLSRLQNMDPDTFEHFVADVCGRLGWDTRVVGKPGDRGIDLIATGQEEMVLIQAKEGDSMRIPLIGSRVVSYR